MPKRNEWELKGHAGKDAKPGQTSGGKPMVLLSVPFTETDRDGNEKATIWYPVFVYGKAAEQALYVKKGDAVFCVGKPFVLKGKDQQTGAETHNIGMNCFYMEHLNWHKKVENDGFPEGTFNSTDLPPGPLGGDNSEFP